VRDAHKTRRCDRTTCILDRGTNVLRKGHTRFRSATAVRNASGRSRHRNWEPC
jgi:hypothetical protein